MSISQIQITWNAVIDLDILLIAFVHISVWHGARGLHTNTHTSEKNISNQIHSSSSDQGTYTDNARESNNSFWGLSTSTENPNLLIW